ncbi:1-deoxy-D-xylulose-5-phosphate reductoisomerase [bacterium]|nr:1-deoxy-D-xylulose-5-phosphate reductoisomerase [bacterium]
MSGKKHIVILGSTGSIGRSTLDVIRRHPDRFCVEALAARRNVTRLYNQIKKFKPRLVALADETAARDLKEKIKLLKNPPRIAVGLAGVRQAAVAPRADTVLSAMVGSAGLVPTLDAIRSGKDIALANKETLVMAGEIVMDTVRHHKVKLLPVDSEHAALAQCLQGHDSVPVRRLILTASGGPFVDFSQAKLNRVTVQQALRHPTWSMGRKITIDSSTLMNKGLEIIEAHHLFGMPYKQIEVVVHRQSIVHSMVEYVDGSILAQMSNPDMRLPIQTALTAPERIPHIVKPLDFKTGLNLSFGPPDMRRFPCLGLAYQAGKTGRGAPAVINAVNEVAVQAFLQEELDFPGIARIIGMIFKKYRPPKRVSLEDIIQADTWARQAAKEAIACRL